MRECAGSDDTSRCAVCGLPLFNQWPLTGWHIGCRRGDCKQRDRIVAGGFRLYAPARAEAETKDLGDSRAHVDHPRRETR